MVLRAKLVLGGPSLEAIKLFLYVPRTAFIIGADERLVQHAVKRRFPEIGDDAASSAHEKFDLGRDYLEKLVQVLVRIPLVKNKARPGYLASAPKQR